MFINQFAEHDGTGAAIKSPPLRLSKGLDSGGIVPIHEHNVDDVKVLLTMLMPGFQIGICVLTRKPTICWVYQRNMYKANHCPVIRGFSHR